MASGLVLVTCTFTSLPPGCFVCPANSTAFDRMRTVIEIKQHAAYIRRRLARSIVERLLNEIIERHDKPPLIP